jgi:hypothetical protein
MQEYNEGDVLATEDALNTLIQATNKRKLVTVRKINAIDPIEGADAIEVATVDGWKVVVKKGDFKEGDQCVYFEIDSFLPDGNPAWQFLVDKSPKMFEGAKGHKLRTIKLRGQVSQGFVMPLSAFGVHEFGGLILNLEAEAKAEGREFVLRDADLAPFMGIKKWEATLPACLQGQAEGLFPSFIQKTDQERCQNLGGTIFNYEGVQYVLGEWLNIADTQPSAGQFIRGQNADGGEWDERWDPAEPIGQMQRWKPIIERPAKASVDDLYEVTMKIDGSSGTYFARRDCAGTPTLGVCSRNLQLKITEENKENTFVRVLLDTKLDDALIQFLQETDQEIAVQGEIMGPGIQGNREGFTSAKFFVFDIYDIGTGKYLAPVERMKVYEQLKLLAPTINHVPILHAAVRLKDIGVTSVQDLLAHAEGPSINHKVREGEVYKRLDGQFSFKAISNGYLMKERD